MLSLLFTAVALLLTVENALNQMWQVKRNRPLLLWMYFSWLVPPVAAMIAANMALKPRRANRSGAASGASARRRSD